MDSCGRHNGIINPEESGNFDPITNAAPTNERTGDRPTKSNPFGFLALPRATPSLRGGEGERGRGSCNKLCLVRGRRNICQRGEREEQRASHKGELIKRLNFQEWPSVRPSVHSFVRKAIEISVLSRLTSSRLARFFSGRQAGRQATNGVFMLVNTKGLLLSLPLVPAAQPLISPEGPETMRNLLKLISNSFQKKWTAKRRFKWPPWPALPSPQKE